MAVGKELGKDPYMVVEQGDVLSDRTMGKHEYHFIKHHLLVTDK